MFIQIRHEDKKIIEYINIFKIISIKPMEYVSDAFKYDNKKVTAITMSGGSNSYIICSYEPVDRFVGRLKKELDETNEKLNRLEILDL